MKYFVAEDSIVREIWGKSDTVLLIFAGAAAEFALNKAVDWLYFTGQLPKDPLGRLFSTVVYARSIVFSERATALHTIDAMAKIHRIVEEKRGRTIPDWAYRDVLFMLIDCSIRSFEIMERNLELAEKREVFNVFHRLGSRMGIKGLPDTFEDWKGARQRHLDQNLERSRHTEDLYSQYHKHLGIIRYHILVESQILIVSQEVRQMLGFRKASFLKPMIGLYKLSKRLRVDWLLKAIILPSQYKNQIRGLDNKLSYA